MTPAFETPAFRTDAARHAWNGYFAEVDRLLRRAGDDAAELRADLAAHLADSFAAGDPATPEATRLDDSIRRLGRPAEYLRPLIADELLDRGTRSFNPVPLARGLYYSIGHGAARTMAALGFGLGYLLLAAFAAMVLLKPLWGDHVGLFRRPDGTVSFGIVADPAGARELLGFWIVPIALAVAALLYVVLTRALRAVRVRR